MCRYANATLDKPPAKPREYTSWPEWKKKKWDWQHNNKPKVARETPAMLPWARMLHITAIMCLSSCR